MTAIDDEMSEARAGMVREVERAMADIARATGQRVDISSRIMAALSEIPRHLFVPPEHLAEAYLNRPVPIGYGQTISQPLIVALMTELLAPEPGDRVLEIGTGSGYQTAILSRLVGTVFTVELAEPLAERAQRAFDALGLRNVTARVGDGHLGWPEEAPFDGILVTAAPQEVPPALLDQLKPGGRLVIPIGERTQQLIVVEKQSDQSTVLREIISVCFVPLLRPGALPD